MEVNGPYDSLDDWLWKTRTTQRELARMAKWDQPALSEFLALKRGCSVPRALALSKVTGVPVEKLVPWRKLRTTRKPKQSKTRAAGIINKANNVR